MKAIKASLVIACVAMVAGLPSRNPGYEGKSFGRVKRGVTAAAEKLRSVELKGDVSPEVTRHKRDVNWPAYLSAEEQETSYNDHQILRQSMEAANMEYMVRLSYQRRPPFKYLKKFSH